jgi:hypothetical protein
MYCICCNKNNVTPLEDPFTGDRSETELLFLNEMRENGRERTVNNLNVRDGIIHIIEAGYGSTHDGDKYIIAICDVCIDMKKQDATLLYYDNCMFSDFVEDDINKSKTLYNRRKNLDGLIG